MELADRTPVDANNPNTQPKPSTTALRRVPWFPRRREGRYGEGRERSMAERVFLSVSAPESCVFAEWFVCAVMMVVLVSCVVFVLDSMRSFQEYSEECEQCKPLEGNALLNTTLVDERAGLADECADCEPEPLPVLFNIEGVCMGIFTLEYAVRLVTAYSVRSWREINIGRLPLEDDDFVFSSYVVLRRTLWHVVHPMNIVDLFSILPFFFSIGGSKFAKLGVVRVIRLLRVLSLFKMGSFCDKMMLFLQVIGRSMTGFAVLVMLAMFGAVVFGGLVFYAERGEWDPATGRYLRNVLDSTHPKEESPFTDIPTSFWWVFVTFTTVGYGDMTPTTPWGLAVGIVAMYFGVVFMAMPIAIVGGNFTELYTTVQTAQQTQLERKRQQQRVLLALLRQRLQLRLADAFGNWRELSEGGGMRRKTSVGVRVERAVREALATVAAQNEKDKESERVEVGDLAKRVQVLEGAIAKLTTIGEGVTNELRELRQALQTGK